MNLQPLALLALAGLLLLGCSTPGQGGDYGPSPTNPECASTTMCPPGTAPSEERDSQGACDNVSSGSNITQEGMVRGRCQGTGSCRVLCAFPAPVPCCKGLRLDVILGRQECDEPCAVTSSAAGSESMPSSQDARPDAGAEAGRADPQPSVTDAAPPAESAPDDRMDPGDSKETAFKLGYLLERGDTVPRPAALENGFVGPTDSTDLFEFHVSRLATLSIALESKEAQSAVQAHLLYDATILNLNSPYLTLPVASLGKPVVSSVNLESGTYYLRVFPYNGAASLYRLQLSAVAYDVQEPAIAPGHTPAKALAIGTLGANPQQYGGYVRASDGSDYYRFSLDSAGTVQVSGSNVHGGIKISIYQYADPPTAPLKPTPLFALNTDVTSPANLDRGSYLLGIESYGNEPGNLYTLTLQLVSP